jgi:hypothetical protein
VLDELLLPTVTTVARASVDDAAGMLGAGSELVVDRVEGDMGAAQFYDSCASGIGVPWLGGRVVKLA